MIDGMYALIGKNANFNKLKDKVGGVFCQSKASPTAITKGSSAILIMV